MIEHVPSVSEHWLLAGIAPELVEPAISVGRSMHCAPGEIIFREGDQGDGLYLTIAGNVSVTARGPHGDAFLALVQPNEVLGELSVLDGGPRSGTAQAVTVCALYFIPTEPFVDLLERSTLVCMRLLGLLAQRLRGADIGLLVELRPANPRGA